MTDMNYAIFLLIRKNHGNMGALSISPLVVYYDAVPSAIGIVQYDTVI